MSILFEIQNLIPSTSNLSPWLTSIEDSNLIVASDDPDLGHDTNYQEWDDHSIAGWAALALVTMANSYVSLGVLEMVADFNLSSSLLSSQDETRLSLDRMQYRLTPSTSLAKPEMLLRRHPLGNLDAILD